mmetsp:Transcript_64659/g.154373  ORF Transcript_64659/g.154373 Transcript_64659/m.154373 type:complete len:284 (+) Transcript_64659:663-1514(+)
MWPSPTSTSRSAGLLLSARRTSRRSCGSWGWQRAPRASSPPSPTPSRWRASTRCGIRGCSTSCRTTATTSRRRACRRSSAPSSSPSTRSSSSARLGRKTPWKASSKSGIASPRTLRKSPTWCLPSRNSSRCSPRWPTPFTQGRRLRQTWTWTSGTPRVMSTSGSASSGSFGGPTGDLRGTCLPRSSVGFLRTSVTTRTPTARRRRCGTSCGTMGTRRTWRGSKSRRGSPCSGATARARTLTTPTASGCHRASGTGGWPSSTAHAPLGRPRSPCTSWATARSPP